MFGVSRDELLEAALKSPSTLGIVPRRPAPARQIDARAPVAGLAGAVGAPSLM